MAPGFVHPEVWRSSWLGYCLWFLGYPDQALAREQQAVACAEATGDRGSIYFALAVETAVLLHRGEGAAAQESLHAALQTGNPVTTDFLNLAISYFQGWSLVQIGQLEEGLAQLDRVTSAARSSPVRLDWTKFLATVAWASLRSGRIERAAASVREALDAAASLGEHYYEPELHRLQGEVRLAAGAEADAELSFEEALHIARKQNAKSWELRTTMSLARLWAAKGRKDEAHAALSAVYAWFTEGFTTPDLQAANRLLRELAQSGNTPLTVLAPRET